LRLPDAQESVVAFYGVAVKYPSDCDEHERTENEDVLLGCFHRVDVSFGSAWHGFPRFCCCFALRATRQDGFWASCLQVGPVLSAWLRLAAEKYSERAEFPNFPCVFCEFPRPLKPRFCPFRFHGLEKLCALVRGARLGRWAAWLADSGVLVIFVGRAGWRGNESSNKGRWKRRWNRTSWRPRCWFA